MTAWRQGGVSSRVERRPDLLMHSFHPRQGFRRLRRTSVAAALEQPSSSFPQRWDKVEAIEVHHLVPGSHEVFRKLLLRVRARIDFREGAQLRVRTEDQVGTRAGPLDRVRLAVAALEDAFSGWLPLRAHVEQVDEEVVRQRLGPLGEDAVLGLPGIYAQDAQAADED